MVLVYKNNSGNKNYEVKTMISEITDKTGKHVYKGDVENVLSIVATQKYIRYSGGNESKRICTIMHNLEFDKKMEIQFTSKSECKYFEDRIKENMVDFTRRKYPPNRTTTTIRISRKNKQRIDDLRAKNDRYDTIIGELLDFWETNH